jgi:hypothetical protein
MTSTGGTNSVSQINSNLQTVNRYEVNKTQGLGGGIVNYSNVRGFLNDVSNSIIINDFFSYLTGNTSSVEFYEIYSSDQKLSNVFDNYYQSSVVNNEFPSSSAIDESLANTMGIIFIDNITYNFDGFSPTKGLDSIPLSINDSKRINKSFSALTTFTYEPSYYVPVFIKRSYNQTDREKVYFDNIMQQINDYIPEGKENNDGDSDYGGYEGY